MLYIVESRRLYPWACVAFLNSAFRCSVEIFLRGVEMVAHRVRFLDIVCARSAVFASEDHCEGLLSQSAAAAAAAAAENAVTRSVKGDQKISTATKYTHTRLIKAGYSHALRTTMREKRPRRHSENPSNGAARDAPLQF